MTESRGHPMTGAALICSRLPPSSWVGQPTIGRPFNVQAKGGLWPTRAFYAECAQVRAGRQSRNDDFILIAAKRRYHNPRPEGPSPPSTQPADVVGPNLRRQPPPPPFGPFEPSEPGPQSGPFPYIKNIFSCIDVIVNLYYHRFKLTNAL